MTKKLFLQFILITPLFGISSPLSKDSLGFEDQEIVGSKFINLSFIKAGENFQTYNLERAIDGAKEFLNSHFIPYKIKFHFSANIESIDSPEKMVQSWNNYSLPHLENELAIYVHPGIRSEKETHNYHFLLESSDIAIVPYYNQTEFNHYVLKNVLHMLGLDVLKFNTWKSKQENQFELFIAKELNIENRLFVCETVKLQQRKKRNKKKAQYAYQGGKQNQNSPLNKQIALIARKNISVKPILMSKATRFNIPISPYQSSNTRSVTTITQLD
tara:strand:- start:225 stop:1040 length:816 start_codon:yes stop_codon:yes gene_type:complete